MGGLFLVYSIKSIGLDLDIEVEVEADRYIWLFSCIGGSF